MTSKAPAAPPANRSPKGTGDPKVPPRDARAAPHGAQPSQRPEQKGDDANIRQNTRNQGYQQDR